MYPKKRPAVSKAKVPGMQASKRTGSHRQKYRLDPAAARQSVISGAVKQTDTDATLKMKNDIYVNVLL